MFVCVFDASSVDSFHVGKVDQRSNDGFYRFASHSNHFLGIFLVLGEFLVHAVVMFFVNAVVYFLELGTFTTTLFSEWAVFTICFATSVRAFGVAFAIGFFAFEK